MCLEESLYIHNIRDMKVLHTIRETPTNPSGECDGWSGCHNISRVDFIGVCAIRSVRPVHQQRQLLPGLPRQRYDRGGPGV